MRKWTVCLLVLAVLMLAATAVGEEQQREVITSGDWQYVVLEDGTAEITRYTGEAETLEIPESIDGISVTRIGDEAFYYCYRLTSVMIPDGVSSIGVNPFSTCDKLTSIRVTPDNSNLAVIEGALVSKSNKQLVCYPAGITNKVYQISDGIRTIGAKAFFYNFNLTSVTIPDSVTSIGNEAFSNCEKLTSITLPNGVTSIGDMAFNGCSDLTSITIQDGLTSIGMNPFTSCDKLTNIRVSPDDSYLAVIDGVLFSKPDKRLVCYPGGLINQTYQIPEGIRIIGDGAFFLSNNLTSITIPNTVTSIGFGAFSWNFSLTSITIPDSVTNIGERAFAYCDNLTNITIPDSVTTIGDEAFHGCPNLILTVSRDGYAAQYCKDNILNYPYPDANDWLTAP